MAKSKDDVTWTTYLVICVVFLCSVPSSQNEDFSPPVVQVQRDWNIPEDEPVGTRVAQARALSGGALEFGIEESSYRDGSSYFRIDSKTGAIYLNESMQGKKGQQYYLFVTGYNGVLATKTEVWVKITGSQSHSGVHPPGQTFKNELPIKPQYPPLTPEPGAQIPKLPPSSDDILSPKQESGSEKEKSTQIPTNNTEFPLQPVPTVTDRNTNSNNKTGDGAFVYNPGSPSSPVAAKEKDGNNQYDPILSNEIGSSKAEDRTRLASTSPSNSNGEDSTNYSVIILTVVPIVIIFGLVPIIVGALWLVRKKRNKLSKRPTKELRKESAATTNSNVTMSTEGESPNALLQWAGKRAQSNRYESWNPDDPGTQVQNRWEFPRHHLQIGGILGEGCFGQVWRCEALNIDGKEGTTTVAVKTLKESAGERERMDLLSELTVMKMLDAHPNVVRLLGSCTEKDPIFVIMEYVALGKLQSYLRNSRAQHYYGNLHADSSSLSSKDLTAFAYQVARGMEYLASKGIIHRDLAARNVLIDKERICKVADFGFARDVVANHVYERKTDDTKLPIRWMAPEALYDNIFTTKTDVWSFGVLMWEIVTLGSTPYPGMSAGEVMRKVRDGYRLDKPEHCRRELYNILFYCWAHNPDDRPTFSDLVNFLRHLLFSETDYIELDRFPDHDYYNMNGLSGEKL